MARSKLETWRDLLYLGAVIAIVGLVVYLGAKVYSGIKAGLDAGKKLGAAASAAFPAAMTEVAQDNPLIPTNTIAGAKYIGEQVQTLVTEQPEAAQTLVNDQPLIPSYSVTGIKRIGAWFSSLFGSDTPAAGTGGAPFN